MTTPLLSPGRPHALALLVALAGGCFDPQMDDPADTTTGADDDGSGGDADVGDDAPTGGADDTDPNPSDDDGSAPTPDVCGDGQVTGDEVCDDGVNDGAYGTCAPGCGKRAGTCGDGKVDADGGEICDDGTNDGGYGECAPGCQAWDGFCGDGIVQAPETCDTDDNVPEDGCTADCHASGSVDWSVEFVSPNEGAQLDAAAMGVGAAGEALVLANETGSDLPDHWWRVRFDVSDGSLVAADPVITASDRRVYGGAFVPNESVAVGSTTAGGFFDYDLLPTAGAGTTNNGEPYVDADIQATSGVYFVATAHGVRARNTAGAELWSYDWDSFWGIGAIACTSSNGVVVAIEADPVSYSGALAMLDAMGEPAGIEFIDTPLTSTSFPELIERVPGGFVVAGSLVYDDSTTPHAFIGLYDSNLQEQWLHMDAEDEPGQHWTDLTVTDTGTIVVVGSTTEGFGSARARKYTADGNVAWTADEAGFDTYDAVMPTGSYGAVLVAAHYTAPSGEVPLWVARLHP